ncbi:hypothetical protein [Ideonella sp. YS5]|uniref:hypothetical protein n=1 Tax=Ideonella sp. YS5 TaxID=3453714 RepID=UPI003EED4888
MQPTHIRTPSFTGVPFQHDSSSRSTSASPSHRAPGQRTHERPDGLETRRASSPEPAATGRPRAALPAVGSTGDRFEANTAPWAFPADLLTEVATRLGEESAAALASINEGNRDDLPAVVDKITTAQAECFWEKKGFEGNRVIAVLAKVIAQLPPEHLAGRLAGIASWLSQSEAGATSVHVMLEASQKLPAHQRQKVFDTMLGQMQYNPDNLHLLSKAVWTHPHERPIDEMLKIVRSFEFLKADPRASTDLRHIVSEMPISKIGSDDRLALVNELARVGQRIDPTDWVGKAWQMVCEANDPQLLQKSFNPLMSLIPDRIRHFGESFESNNPLKSMAERLGELPETELRPAWAQMKEILRSRPELVEATALAHARGGTATKEAMLAGLMETVPRLAPEMQGEAAALIKGHWPASSKALVKLASVIPKLTEEAREKAFEAVVSCLEEAEKKLRHSLAGPGPSRAAFAQMGGLEGLLVPMSRAAGALPDHAPRAAAVDQVLKWLPHVSDPSSLAEALKSLARALPAVLERPVPHGATKRDALLQSFAEQAKRLPPEHRAPALKEMIGDTQAYAGKPTSFFSRDKSQKLPALLQKLLDDSTR